MMTTDINSSMNALIVLLGPTGVGKTELSLRIAEYFNAPIISSDSRQVYKDLPIGTAAPTAVQMARVRHYLVGMTNPVAVMTGGSMMYIDAVIKGIDDIPTVLPEIREAVWQDYEQNGLAPLLEELKMADPVHYEEVDRNNYKRVIHAVEICRQTGLPYSSYRTRQHKERPFRIIQIGLKREREELCERINQRVDQMMADGLLEEARRVYPFRHLNSLNTVGYKELFHYLDGEWPLDFAVEKIKRNSRVYARKQMTWFKRNPDIVWFHPDQETEIMAYIKSQLEGKE